MATRGRARRRGSVSSGEGTGDGSAGPGGEHPRKRQKTGLASVESEDEANDPPQAPPASGNGSRVVSMATAVRYEGADAVSLGSHDSDDLFDEEGDDGNYDGDDSFLVADTSGSQNSSLGDAEINSRGSSVTPPRHRRTRLHPPEPDDATVMLLTRAAAHAAPPRRPHTKVIDPLQNEDIALVLIAKAVSGEGLLPAGADAAAEPSAGFLSTDGTGTGGEGVLAANAVTAFGGAVGGGDVPPLSPPSSDRRADAVNAPPPRLPWKSPAAIVNPSLDVRIEEVEGKGRGVITQAPVPARSFVCAYTGVYTDEAGAEARERGYEASGAGCYMYYLEHPRYSGTWICIDGTDASFSPSRFLNHADAAAAGCNLFVYKIDFAGRPFICFFARRDVAAGEELCYDYADSQNTTNFV